MTDRDDDDFADLIGQEVLSTLEETFDEQNVSTEKRRQIKARLSEQLKNDIDSSDESSGSKSSEERRGEESVDRRGFLKALGGIAAALGLGGLAEKASAIQFKSDKGITYNGNQVWHAGNDGSGSNLNADTVDGQEASSLGGSVNSTKNNTPSVVRYLKVATDGRLFITVKDTSSFNNVNPNPSTFFFGTYFSPLTKIFAKCHNTGTGVGEQSFNVYKGTGTGDYITSLSGGTKEAVTSTWTDQRTPNRNVGTIYVTQQGDSISCTTIRFYGNGGGGALGATYVTLT